MPNLYGSGGAGSDQSLYGSYLSDRNQDQAKQLNIPGAVQQPGGPSQAGGQQAAESDWANFEDYFNKNRDYIAKANQEAATTVNKAAGNDQTPQKLQGNPNAPVGRRDSTQGAQGSSGQAPFSAAPLSAQTDAPVNPKAPPQLQAGSIADVQKQSDLLQGYGGATNALNPQKYTGLHGGTTVKTPPRNPNDPPESDAPPDSQPSPQPASQPAAQPQPTQPAPTPPADQQVNYGVGATTPDQAKSQTQTPAQNALDQANKDVAATQGFDPNNPFSQTDMTKLGQLTQANNLLAGWGGGTDDQGNPIQGDNGLDVLRQGNKNYTQEDADLMMAGGGRQTLQNLQQAYKGKDKELAGQMAQKASQQAQEAKGAQDQQSIFQGLVDKQGAAGPAAGSPSTPGQPASSAPSDYGSYDDFTAGDVMAQLHETALEMSPADAALVEAGRGGANVPTAASYFRNGMGDENTQNTKIALNAVNSKWGQDAGKWLWQHASPELWQALKGSKNFGYSEYLMDQFLQGSGYKPVGRGTGGSLGSTGSSAGTRHAN